MVFNYKGVAKGLRCKTIKGLGQRVIIGIKLKC